jgi:hypothetical protein
MRTATVFEKEMKGNSLVALKRNDKGAPRNEKNDGIWGLLALFFALFSTQKNIIFTHNCSETGHVNMQHLL